MNAPERLAQRMEPCVSAGTGGRVRVGAAAAQPIGEGIAGTVPLAGLILRAPPTRFVADNQRQRSCRARVLYLGADPARAHGDLDRLRMQFEVAACRSDADITCAIDQFGPDIVCVELHDNDGREAEAVVHLRRQHPGIAVLLVSASLSPSLARMALCLQVGDLLVKPMPPEQLDNAVVALSRSIVRSRSAELYGNIRRSETSRRRPLQPALAFINANVHRRVSLRDCARACNLSPCEFSRRFSAEQGMNFGRYVLRLRIERAIDILAQSRQPVSDIAYAVGFNDLSYFGRVFRRYVGMSPSAYRESLG